MVVNKKNHENLFNLSGFRGNLGLQNTVIFTRRLRGWRSFSRFRACTKIIWEERREFALTFVRTTLGNSDQQVELQQQHKTRKIYFLCILHSPTKLFFHRIRITEILATLGKPNICTLLLISSSLVLNITPLGYLLFVFTTYIIPKLNYQSTKIIKEMNKSVFSSQ